MERSEEDSPQGSEQAMRPQPALSFIFEFL